MIGITILKIVTGIVAVITSIVALFGIIEALTERNLALFVSALFYEFLVVCIILALLGV